MPNQPKPAPGTRGHYISKVPDELWEAAQSAARYNGESVSAVVRRALAEYIMTKHGMPEEDGTYQT